MTKDKTIQGRADGFDSILVLIFLIGIYLEFGPRIAAGVPVPAAPAGLAGAILLIRHFHWIEERQFIALIAVIGLYLASVLSVPDSLYLGERIKGFIQIAYSLVIGYALFITLLRFDRDRLARIFLIFCLLIVAGCALENYTTGFRKISNAVRAALFTQHHLYESDLRDQVLYGGIRPKLFSSEPSYVAYALTLYAFAWYVLSRATWKIVGYFAILGCGVALIRSPTLVLGGLLVVPYELLLASRSAWGRISSLETSFAKLVILSIAVVAALGIVGNRYFSERVTQIQSSNDASFFFRVVGPFLVAKDTVTNHPVAGAGLTGEEYIAKQIVQNYVTSPAFANAWSVEKVNEAITNYFWHHWIYLGLGWGIAILIALTTFLRTLGPPSTLFCWAVWAIMGQASGAYVSPKPWATLLIACAVAVVHHREPANLRWRLTPAAARPIMGMPRAEPRLMQSGRPG